MVCLANDVLNVATDERGKCSIATLVNALEIFVKHQVGDGIEDLIEDAFFSHAVAPFIAHYLCGG